MFSVRIPACLPGYKGRVLGSGGAEGKEPGSFMITGGCLQNIGTSVLGDVCPRRIFFLGFFCPVFWRVLIHINNTPQEYSSDYAKNFLL